MDYGGLAQASKLAQDIADRSSSATSRMRLDLVAAAIPGSVSAGRANALDATLAEAARNIGANLAAYSFALATTAENYRAVEDTAAGAVGQFFGGAT